MFRIFAIASFTMTCWAQGTPEPLKIGSVIVQGSIRTRVENWNWFQGDTGDNSYAFSGTLARLGLSQKHESWEWQLEFAMPLLLGLPDNSIAAGAQGQLGMGAGYFAANNRERNAVGVFAKQGFIRFTSLGGNRNHTLRLGRFEYLDGSEMTPENATLAALKRDRINQRLLGNFGFSHIGRSYDGFHYTYGTARGNFTFVGALPARGVFQTDGWGETSTAIGYAAFTKPWSTGRHKAETRGLVLYYHDWRHVLKTDARALAVRRGDLANIRIATFGGHSIHSFDTRPAVFDALVWGVGQTGKWGVQDHAAYAIAVEGGFQPKILPKLKPWIRGGFFNGSGDSNPNDAHHDTFFQVLPTPRPFARFPFFNLMNNRDRNAALILRPHAKITISNEFHGLRLSDRNDLWYSGGGVFQPWTFGYTGRAASGAQSLANLYDTSVEYRLNPRVTLTGYYGYAQGLAVMKAIYPRGSNGGLGYIEIAYRF